MHPAPEFYNTQIDEMPLNVAYVAFFILDQFIANALPAQRSHLDTKTVYDMPRRHHDILIS